MLARDHEDYYIFRLGNPFHKTFIGHDCVLGWGAGPIYTLHDITNPTNALKNNGKSLKMGPKICIDL